MEQKKKTGVTGCERKRDKTPHEYTNLNQNSVCVYDECEAHKTKKRM